MLLPLLTCGVCPSMSVLMLCSEAKGNRQATRRLTFICPFELRRMGGGAMVWVLKGQEEIHIEMEKQMLGEHILLGHLNNEVTESDWVRLASPGSSCHSPALAPTQSL